MSESGQQAIAAIIERWKLARGESNASIAEALADQGIETTHSTVSLWLRCKQDLRPDEVFALERVLDCEPGELSAHLGYIPVGEIPGVIQAVDADPNLSDDAKQALRDTYGVLVERARKRRNRR